MTNRNYRHAVDVRRTSVTTNADYVPMESASIVDTFYGNLQMLSGDKVVIGDSNTILANYRLFMPVGITIQPDDVLKILDTEYAVHSIDNLMETHQEILLRNKV